MDYKVMRPHLGDRPYQSGDRRSAKAATVSHLVAKGVLAPFDPSDDPPDDPVVKQDAAPENKAAEPPQNAQQTAPVSDPGTGDKSKPKD
jgi:hypothetical protein